MNFVIALLIANCFNKLIDSKNKNKNELIKAIEDKDLEKSSSLINLGSNLEDLDKNGDSALIAALGRGLNDIAILLIEKGANVDVLSSSGSNTLTIAASLCNKSICNLLLDKGLNINSKNREGNNALIISIFRENYTFSKALIERGADVNVFNSQKKTPLFYLFNFAIKNFDIASLLIEKRADVNLMIPFNNLKSNYTSNEKINILGLAIKNRDLESISFLVERGVDLNSICCESNYEKQSAIELCFSDLDLISFLIEKGLNFNVRPTLIKAYENGFEDVVKLLIKKNANLELRNSFSKTILMRAVEKGDTKLVKLLIDKGADVNSLTQRGISVLMLALAKLELDIAEILIKSGSDVNYKRKGKSILHNKLLRPIKFNCSLNLDTERLNLKMIKMFIECENYNFKDINYVFKNYIKEENNEIKEILNMAINRLSLYYNNFKKYDLYNLELAICRLHSQEIFNYDKEIKENYIKMLKSILFYIAIAIQKLETKHLIEEQKIFLEEIKFGINILISNDLKIKTPKDMFTTIISFF